MSSVLLPKAEKCPTMTIEQAAKVLGLGRATAYRYAAQGLIPALKIGSCWVVPTAGLRQLVGLEP